MTEAEIMTQVSLNDEALWFMVQWWESIGSQCHALMGTPGFGQWWEMRGSWFSPSFQEHIEETLEGLRD